MNQHTLHAVGAAALSMSILGGDAMAQLTPDQLYYGIDRRIAMTASSPNHAEGTAAEIRLFPAPEMDGTPASAPLETAAIELGRVDLAGLFPRLWQADPTRVQTLYAQLAVDGEEVGSPVVLQPLATPQRAKAAGRQISWPPSSVTYAGVRAYPDRHVVLNTTAGEMEFHLRPDQAPNTCWNFRHLAEGGFYTDVVFHRIVAEGPGGHPFVIQVGDPTARGTGGPGYQIDLERSRMPHDFGVISMARGPDPDSNGSQVFVCLSREGTSILDGQYTAFGYCVRGGEPVVEIGKIPTSGPPRNNPLGDNPPKIVSARLVEAPTYSRSPMPSERPTPGADR